MTTSTLGVRPATAAEIADYETVDAIMLAMDDDAADALIEKIGDYAFSYGAARKIAYNRLYKVAKQFGIKVDAFVNWYAMDVID